MLNRLRTSIVLRSSCLVLGIAILVGCLFAVFSHQWETTSERGHAKQRMEDLLSTVENTVSIACYLSDKHLATEVAQGLLKNQDVAGITININHSNTRLVDLKRIKDSSETESFDPQNPNALLIVRKIASPFNANETVCEIQLLPNLSFIQAQINQKAGFSTMLLILQTLAMASVVVLVVLYMITRPIKLISDRLHRLNPNEGASLPLPAGNEKDEIGQLVRDVNTLFSKFIHLLKMERELRLNHEIGEKKFRAIFENAETGIFLLKPNGEIISTNPAYLRILGIATNPEASMISNSLVYHLKEYALRLHNMLEAASTTEAIASEDFCVEVGNPAQKKWLNLVLSKVEDEILQGLLNDITERKLAEENANQLAATDHLTGIANRFGFNRAIDILKEEMRSGIVKEFYFLMIDLDKFKGVNDQFGHEVGDQVLCRMTEILCQNIRKSDFIARIGGDEFIVILKNIHEMAMVNAIADKIVRQTAAPIQIAHDIQIRIGASTGISYVNQIDFDAVLVLKQADKAMYQAKRLGKNQWSLYQNDL